MNLKNKMIVVALPLAVITFLLGRVIWPDVPGMAMPTATQLPLFMFISALESIAFGVGVAFALVAWPHVAAAGKKRPWQTPAFVAITWMLVSWWPHDNMHRVNGMDNLAGLLRIEYIFHVTLIASGCVVALFFWNLLTETG
jgi:hypothetical protein